MTKTLRTPRGTKDILPDEQNYWCYLYEKVQEQMNIFGAQRIETPVFEYAEVFTRAIGKGTDIIDKEMFEVRRASTIPQAEDESETKMLVLRPEYTAGIARAWLQNGLNTWPQPVKLWYWGPIFRYERPQAGRFRIHNQFGVEIIGDGESLTDTSAIMLALQILEKIGLKDNLRLDINSIGCATCRPKMRKKLVEFFQNFLEDLCPDCSRRFVENPLRILDCKETKCQKIINSAPQLIDLLCNECKSHFKEVLENLDNLQIGYNLNPRLVRGLDYYTRTVFEIYMENNETDNLALLAGGRYDALLETLGGQNSPAVGWAAGVERIISCLKDRGVAIPEEKMTDICLIHVGEKATNKALNLLSELTRAGFRVTNILGKESLKAQLRAASKMATRICLIIGQREVIDKSVIFKDMESGSQETIKQEKLVEMLKKKLK